MTREDIIRMAREAGGGLSCIAEPLEHPWKFSESELMRFAALVAAAEREAIAKMFDDPMRLVPFVQNHLGGCMVCGFTPKMAADAIRARGSSESH